MPLIETTGNVTADAYGGGVAAKANYIEDVFSTWLYTGNGSTQTITNGIDLAGKGGLVWSRRRDPAQDHWLQDTAQGVSVGLSSNLTNAAGAVANAITAFNAAGYSLGSTSLVNGNGSNYVGWTFRKQPKFFDVVTYTGNGVNGRSISHALGSSPGCIIIKRTDVSSDWKVYHIKGGNGSFAGILKLNTTDASDFYNSTTADNGYPGGPTVSAFSVYAQNGITDVNASGGTYVAYLFAHNAGGFGLTGTDNVISCGSFTSNASDIATVDLGFEPQLVIMKAASTTGQWWMADNMRGFTTSGEQYLLANSSGAEAAGTNIRITNTGFIENSTTGSATTYIYIAIRRGPMKVPTDGTKVFAPVTYAGDGTTGRIITTGIVTDMILGGPRASASFLGSVNDRLRGATQLKTTDTTAEAAVSTTVYPLFDQMSGYNNNGATGSAYNQSSINYIRWAFRRAPGFFDEVCYTGTGTAGQTFSHNLGVAPELMIVKRRVGSSANPWAVYSQSLFALNSANVIELNNNGAASAFSGYWNSTAPTASVFSIGSDVTVNTSGGTYVWYGFASAPGVSKIGTYTGNGTTQTINCGFTGGARFVLIKRTDSTGDWYVYDTARGMTTLTDPYLLLNSTAAESATLGSVTTVTTGFAVNASILAAINTNAASYIYLAIS